MEGFGSAVANALQALAQGKPTNNLNESQNNQQQFQSSRTVSRIRKLEPYEDILRGKAFRGKAMHNLGDIEVVQYTIEDSGKLSVVFKSEITCAMADLNNNFEMIENYKEGMEFTPPQANENLMRGLTFDDGTPVDQVAEDQKLSEDILQEKLAQTGSINKIETKSVPEVKESIKEANPVKQILEKNKFKDEVLCNVEVLLKLPNEGLFNTLINSFDNAESDIIDYILSTYDKDQFKLDVQNAIRKHYGLEPIKISKTDEN